MTANRAQVSLLVLTCTLVILLSGGAVRAERAALPFIDYRTESWFLPQSPGVTGGPVAGLFNPAAFAMTDRVGLDAWWNNPYDDNPGEKWGFAMGRQFGFAMQSRTFGTGADEYSIYDYQLNLAKGGRSGAVGLGYRWSNGSTDLTPSQSVVTLGTISRPWTWLSFGTAGTVSLESRAAQYVFDLGIRPLGRDWLTLFADWTANDDQSFFSGGTWGAGLEVRMVQGGHVGVRARRQPVTGDIEWAMVGGITLGSIQLVATARSIKATEMLGETWLMRTHPPFPGGDPEIQELYPKAKPSRYFALSLENKYITYQRYRLFDDKRIAWLDLLPLLESIRDDEKLGGLVLNLAGTTARASLLWELRQMLEQIQASGKEIIIHGDRFGLGTYYLASVADQLSLDPAGSMTLPGLAVTRTYAKGALEKLGLGFQEFRYFKYKSLVEALSRDSMSDADREQRQRIVDVIYEELMHGIQDGRELSAERFAEVIDEKTMLTAHECKELSLVDHLTRWDDLLRWVGDLRTVDLTNAFWLDFDRTYYDRQWGPAPKIVVVYAVGDCAMDSGIKGRRTSEYLRALAYDPDVAAVVLRADSPGGDSLPSDLVADAIRKLKAAGKPVIVSQGDVAASGGYWISMDGTEVLTTPLTVTGSIGVIAGWIYDDGFSGRLGLTADGVQRGARADLFGKMNLPLFGGLPRRGLTQPELDRVEEMIRSMYDEFVAAVAHGRGLSTEAVEEIAQGRVWMGGDAIELGLCDRFGSLADAIDLARETAGIADWRDVDVVEFPPRPLLQWPTFGPRLPALYGLGDAANRWLAKLYGLDLQAGVGDAALPAGDASLDATGLSGLTIMERAYIKAIAENPAQGLLMVSPDLLPAGWDRLD